MTKDHKDVDAIEEDLADIEEQLNDILESAGTTESAETGKTGRDEERT